MISGYCWRISCSLSLYARCRRQDSRVELSNKKEDEARGGMVYICGDMGGTRKWRQPGVDIVSSNLT